LAINVDEEINGHRARDRDLSGLCWFRRV